MTYTALGTTFRRAVKKVYDQHYRSAWEKDLEFQATIISVYFGKLVMFNKGSAKAELTARRKSDVYRSATDNS
jgi:hypothetical protein